jgi:MFS family permease
LSEGRITSQQWKGLIAAWLGWAFDGLDGYLYVLVAGPFVASLLKKPLTDPDVAVKGAIIQGFFLIGWAIGGAVFGRIGDRLGPSRTLTLTILTYAIFTGMAFFATEWWHLLIYRFIAALGIGGEWAAGSALVSEMLHKKHRAWASAALQSGYMSA